MLWFSDCFCSKIGNNSAVNIVLWKYFPTSQNMTRKSYQDDSMFTVKGIGMTVLQGGNLSCGCLYKIKYQKQTCFGFLIARRLEIPLRSTLFFEIIWNLPTSHNMTGKSYLEQEDDSTWCCPENWDEIFQEAIFHVAVSIKSNIRNKFTLVFCLKIGNNVCSR